MNDAVDRGSVKRLSLTFGHVGAMLEVYARVEGMRADNAVREFQHESPAWSGECFFEECEKLRNHVVALRRL